MPVIAAFYGILVWIEIHRDELMEDWNLAERGSELRRIEPLK